MPVISAALRMLVEVRQRKLLELIYMGSSPSYFRPIDILLTCDLIIWSVARLRKLS